MATRTNLSTNLDYVTYASGDSMAAIFLQVDACLKAHGWTQASGTSGTFFTTYDPAAGTPSTTDLRRVYSAPLTNSNSGLSTKYIMLRMLGGTSAYNYAALGASTAVQVQIIPFVSWNSGTDTGTNQAGNPLTDAANVNGSYDSSNWNNNDDASYIGKAPHTWFNRSASGFLYVAASAKWICMWPYFVSTNIYDGQSNQQLFYGEISDDFASYTNVPPVFVTTLQRLCYATGTTNEPSIATGGYDYNGYGANLPQFLMPVTPASTTGYTGVSNTTRNGYQAMGGTRIMMGHYGWFGYEGFGWYTNNTSYYYGAYYQPYNNATVFQAYPMAFIQNFTYYSTPQPLMQKYSLKKWDDPGNAAYNNGQSLTSAQSFQQTALNSTNLKGIEPILGGGVMGSASYTGYSSNPYPMYWVLGRAYGLKFVGSPSSGSWSTLDTVNMTTDSNYFYTKTGGTTNSFILLGVGPGSTNLGATQPKTAATIFFALPA